LLRTIIIALLAVVVVGTGYWGYTEHQEKNAVLIQAENNYQRAFHDLSYQVDLLHDKIGATLAMNSRSSLSPTLAEVWQVAANAQTDVGQLPLTLLPFNKTEEFLANIAQFSYRTAIRDLENEPLSDKEYETLQVLYENSKDIQNELRSVQNKVLENNLRWMDVELALASQETPMDNTIIDGFETVEKSAGEFAEVDFGPGVNVGDDDDEFRYVEGEELSEEEAVNRAKEFLNIEGSPDIKITESGKGADNGFYSVTIQPKDEQAEINMDITKKGGYPIWLIQNKQITEKNISLNEASEIATKYLKDHEFDDVEMFESAQYDHVGVFTFVASKDDVRIYPDAIRVKVSLDEGDIIGLSARDYLASHHTRDIPKPSINLEEALKEVNSKVKVMENRLAVIENDLGEEVLTYEILGTINNDTYRIFINAEDGREEKVEKLKNAEPIYGELT
jgi:spore germination protein